MAKRAQRAQRAPAKRAQARLEHEDRILRALDRAEDARCQRCCAAHYAALATLIEQYLATFGRHDGFALLLRDAQRAAHTVCTHPEAYGWHTCEVH